jgi:GT2 family glycosyltransferase
MREQRLPVGIVILNWNKGPSPCPACEQSRNKYRAFKLYIVDNASTDNSIDVLDAIYRDFPDVVRINNSINLATPAAHAGIVRALSDGADYVGC